MVGGLLLFAAGIGAWVWPTLSGSKSNDDDCCRPGGAALGMSEPQVRARMKGAPPGTWASARDGKIEVLTWRASVPSPRFAHEIRFEIHEGLLTAVRARVDVKDNAAKGPGIEITPMLVTARHPRGDGTVDYTSIARDCTAHADEVNALLAAGKKPGDAGR